MTDRSPQALAEACAESMWADDHACHRLGIEIERVAPGEAVLSMAVSEGMINGHGLAHGGFIFALADSAFAYACNGFNQRAVAQQASITYIAPAMLGDRLTAAAKALSRRGRGGIYDVHVTNQRGEQVAEFRGHSRTLKGTHLPE